MRPDIGELLEVTVIKRNLAGEETWRYKGHALQRSDTYIQLEAFFNRDNLPFHGLVLNRGDRFVEEFFSDRWYNIFEMYDRETGVLKGWYCNITRPAELFDETVSYIDLALDLLVYPDGQQLVLDEEEYDALHLEPDDALQARLALAELQQRFAVLFKD